MSEPSYGWAGPTEAPQGGFLGAVEVARTVLNGARSAAPFGRLNIQGSANRALTGCLESCDKCEFGPRRQPPPTPKLVAERAGRPLPALGHTVSRGPVAGHRVRAYRPAKGIGERSDSQQTHGIGLGRVALMLHAHLNRAVLDGADDALYPTAGPH